MINLLKRLNWSSFYIIVTIVPSSNTQFEFRCIHELGGVTDWYQSYSYRETGLIET